MVQDHLKLFVQNHISVFSNTVSNNNDVCQCVNGSNLLRNSYKFTQIVTVFIISSDDS